MKKRLTSLFALFVTVVVLLFGAATPALAQIKPIENNAIPKNLSNYAEANNGTTFSFYIVFLWRALIFVGGFMVIIYFIMASFEWISANGEASKISAARNKMTGAIAGFIVLSALFVLLEFLGGLFGFDVLAPTLPTPTQAPQLIST